VNPPDVKQRTGTLQNISWLSAAEYLSEALYFFRGTILAAVIGPQAFGVWSSMRIAARFLPYAPLGSLQGVLQLAPKADGAGDTATADRYRSTTVALSLMAAILVVIAVVVFSFVGVAPGNFYLWLIFSIALLPMQIYDIQTFMLRSQERFLAIGATKLGLAASTLLFGVFAAWHFGLLGFLVAVGCSYVLVTFLTTRLAQVPPRPLLERAKARRLVTTGSTILVAEILLTLLQNVDKVLVVILLGSHALGLYAIPAYVVHAALLMPQAVATVLYPRLMATLGNTSSSESAWPYLERATIVLAYVSCPALAFLSLVLHLPIEWWLPDYIGAIGPGRALILVAFLPIVAALPATVLISLDAQKKLIAIRALAVIVSIVCIPAAIQYDGKLATVALATAPGFALLALATLFSALQKSGLPLRRRVQVLLAVFTPYAALLLLYRTFGPASGAGTDPMAVAQQVVFVCGPLLLWGVFSARRMGLFRRNDRTATQ
jgi:O-antigen/teichoic acid export membrane protein